MTRDEELFAEARALPPTGRGAFLAQACGDDAGRRARLEELLAGLDYFERALTGPILARAMTSRGEEPGQRIGHYQLVEQIGEGGCGVVWLAAQETPVRRRVALKVIKLGMDTREVIARFEAERQALALMEHPNIARVLDAGATEGGRPFFVMELVRGVAITRYCDEARLTTAQRLQLFIPVCLAIQHAHQKGVIHRDIKPSNVLVTLHDDVPVPKVIDFGIAKATQGKLADQTIFTAFQQFIGTPAYMSPEQAEFNALDVDTRSDVYSLGVLLYELLTGRPPFDPKALAEGGLEQIRRTIREVEPPRPSARLRTLGEVERDTAARQRNIAPAQLPIAVRGDLDWIAMKALEKNRARRYESASALAADVQRYLAHEPIVARPPSAGYVVEKWIRRHRVAFATTALLAATLVVGAAVSTFQAIRATRAEREQARLRAVEGDLRQKAEQQSRAMRRQAYASDLNLAQQALATHDLRRARELLERQRPATGDADLRGWEWRYLWQFCQDQASGLLVNGSVATQLSVSSDGQWLATGGQTAGLWNLRTRQSAPLPAIEGANRSAAQFSPAEPLLAISSWTAGRRTGAQIALWHPGRQQAVQAWPVEQPFARLQFSGDGQTLATIQGSEVVLWRVPTGERLGRVTKTGAADIAFSHDGRLAAIQQIDGRVLLVDLPAGKERLTIKATAEITGAMAFSPDGTILATAGGGADSTIRLWDPATGRERGRLDGHKACGRSRVFWPDGQRLATAGQDQTVRIWNVSTRQLLRTFHGHETPILALALQPDLTTLVSAAADGTLRFWDVAAPGATASAGQLGAPAMGWSFTPDSQAIVTVDRAGKVTRWSGRDFRDRAELASISPPHVRGEPPDRKAVCVAGNAALVAVMTAAGVVQVWDAERAVRIVEFKTGALQAHPVGFVSGGKALLVNQESTDEALRGLFEWDLATGNPARSWRRSAALGDYALSADGRQCAFRAVSTAGRGGIPDRGVGSVIDLVSGQSRAIKGTPWVATEGRFSPDGRLFASPMGPTGTIYATETFEPIRALTATMHGMAGAAFSPDGRRLAFTMTGFEAARLWDTESWEQLLVLEAGASRLESAAFSPDGNVLGAMSHWDTVHFWRAPSRAEIETAEKARAKTNQAR